MFLFNFRVRADADQKRVEIKSDLDVVVLYQSEDGEQTLEVHLLDETV